MVVFPHRWALLAERSQQTVLEKLDPDHRAAVILTLIGLGLLCGLVIALTMLAGRWARQGRPRRSSPVRDQLQRPPDKRPPPDLPADIARGDTFVDRPDKDDTMR